MTKLVELGYDDAVEAIRNEEYVMYKHGVWNPYSKIPAINAINSILKSGYGADVSVDENGIKYVSIPSEGDMW